MDLIERSELLKDLEDLKKSPWYNTGNPFIQQGMRECMDMIETQCIKKALAVDAKPVRHGHWIRKIDTRFGPKLNDIIICSNCNIAFSTEDMFRRSYCPSCGARMDERKEE